MTGKKDRPNTEPMYSGGNIRDFPITSGYHSVVYTEFISTHLFNSENIVICQNFHDGYFSACFAPTKRYSPRPVLCWGIRKKYDTFIKLVEKKSDRTNGRSQQIYALACDENLGFGVFFMENYGSGQSIITSLLDIRMKWEEGFKITACAARGSTLYIIMTKDTNEYKGKQAWFTRNSWQGVSNEILKYYKEGKAITGICYCTGLRQYFVVMTATLQGQTYNRSDDNTARNNWVGEKRKEGFHPTIIFKDPTDNTILVVMTRDDTRSSYTLRINYKVA